MPGRDFSLPAVDILEHYRDPAILLDLEYRILASNQAYKEVFQGEGGEPVEGRCCYAVSHHYEVPCDQSGESCPVRQALATRQPSRVLHVHYTPRGQEHHDVELFPIADARGEIAWFVEVLKPCDIASTAPSDGKLVGRSQAFNAMLELVQRVAPSDTSVLLLGETGTGKEMVARAIHESSRRAARPFVPVECSGLTETLFESELFGHEKGAFTGAIYQKKGLVEAVGGGTLFLDEIGDVPLPLQVKLLRLLETRTYRKVGSVEPRGADFRLVCATHRDLKEMVAQGSFRADLYYRIAPFPVSLPPLRERPRDILLLAESLLADLTSEVGPRKVLAPQARACLLNYSFPGNVRELRNLLERACILSDGPEIGVEHLPQECQGSPPRSALEPTQGSLQSLAQVERSYLQWAVQSFQGEKKELARALGISERTLYRKLQRLELG